MQKRAGKSYNSRGRKTLSHDVRIIKLVKLLARWAAEEDYKAALEKQREKK